MYIVLCMWPYLPGDGIGKVQVYAVPDPNNPVSQGYISQTTQVPLSPRDGNDVVHRVITNPETLK